MWLLLWTDVPFAVVAGSSRPLNNVCFLPPAMHLFGLNWQLQQTENDTFENGKVNSDAMPTNTVSLPSGDNGKRKNHVSCVFLLTLLFHKFIFTRVRASCVWEKEEVLELQILSLNEWLSFSYLKPWTFTFLLQE